MSVPVISAPATPTKVTVRIVRPTARPRPSWQQFIAY